MSVNSLTRHVSVTELLDRQRCARLWALRHERRLEPLGRPHMLASGSAVHATVRYLAQLHAPSLEYGPWRDFAEGALRAEFVLDEHGEEKVQKFLPGVLRAVAKLPDWFFEQKWESEVPLTMQVKVDDEVVEVRGRADFICRNQAEDDIMVVEVKTTENDPLDYLLWNPQHRVYGLMEAQAHPEAVLRFQYLCLPTDKTKKAPQHMPWLFTRAQMDSTLRDLQRLTKEWLAKQALFDASPSYGNWCKWCDFAPVCTAILTGADVRAVVQTQYRKKEARNAE